MDMKVEQSTLDAALQEAVLKALGENGQALIIKSAVEYLTKKDTSNFGRSKSPLDIALERACDAVANTVIYNRLKDDPEFIKNVDELYSEAFKKIFGAENREKVISKLTSAMSEALTKNTGY